MKEKNSNKRRVLLTISAAVLVAIVSVSITLAYLTAVTGEKDNVFKGSGGITIKTLEPKFDTDYNVITEPGHKIDKDPMVQNDCGDQVIVGAKLTFQIAASNTTYTTVPYSDFIKYIDIEGLPILHWLVDDDAQTEDVPFTGTQARWLEVDGNTNGCKYYVYDKILAADDGDVTWSSSQYTGGTSINDNTVPLFTAVTPSKLITIHEGGNCVIKNGTNVTIDNGTGARTAISGVYGSFNFKILIDAYGIKNDGSITGNNGDTAAVKITAAKPTIVSKLG